ncbi:unnamed protein product [Linum trigynum]|uniref:Uncharacterized protein n=1 Tax=Linum trigynum TaxID=586398 RepID=A0AAV2CIG2_9ROSI
MVTNRPLSFSVAIYRFHNHSTSFLISSKSSSPPYVSSPAKRPLVLRIPCRVLAGSYLLRDVGATAGVLAGAYGLVLTFDTLTRRQIIQQIYRRILRDYPAHREACESIDGGGIALWYHRPRLAFLGLFHQSLASMVIGWITLTAK